MQRTLSSTQSSSPISRPLFPRPSRTLPLAGKLVWDPLDPKPSIAYSPNDAVSFTVVESNADFSRLTGNELFPSTELYPLVPELQNSDGSASVVSFQVTLFPNQGFCIGVSAHHAVLDGKMTTMFLKCWAHTCKQQQEQTSNPSLPQDLIPTYDRTIIKSPTDNETKILYEWFSVTKMFTGGKEPQNPKSLKLNPLQEIAPDVFRYTFKFTREDIQMLRERLIRESSSSSKELRLSTFVIVFSYVFVCLIKGRGGEPNRQVGYGFSVDCRSLMNPPITRYFGNCISGCLRMMLKAEMFMGQEGFLAAARMISDSIEEWDENDAWKIPVLVTYSTLPPETQFIVASGSTRFGVYWLDFGWGRPDKVVIVSIGQGNVISMADSRDGNGGVEIGFSLKKHEMNAFIDLLHHGLKI